MKSCLVAMFFFVFLKGRHLLSCNEHKTVFSGLTTYLFIDADSRVNINDRQFCLIAALDVLLSTDSGN